MELLGIDKQGHRKKLRYHLRLLSDPIDKKKNTISEEEFNLHVKPLDHESLNSFLMTKFGEEAIEIKLLKLCHQAIGKINYIFPNLVVVCFLGYLGEVLFYKMDLRCKDVRNTWEIHIKKHFGNEDKETFISVIHRRTEQVVSIADNVTLTNLFQFQWQVEISFNNLSLHHIDSINAELLNIDWQSLAKEMTEEEKTKMESEFRNTFGNPNIKSLELVKKEVKRQSIKMQESIKKSMNSKSGFKGFFPFCCSIAQDDDIFNFEDVK